MTANLAIPAGAVTTGDWILDLGTARSFRGEEVTIDALHGSVGLTAAGDQGIDGQIERYALVEIDCPLTADELRRLAVAALVMADEMTHLAEVDEMAGLVVAAELTPPHCRYCTVPSESGNVCTFCDSYVPPEPGARELVVLAATTPIDLDA